MKVICIDGKPNYVSIFLPEGVPLNVTDGKFFDDCYIVEGYEFCPVNNNHIEWRKRRFLPLSNIDEMELLEQREEQLQSL